MKNLLVLGGAGQLGISLIRTFKIKSPIWNVINIDYNLNTEADVNHVIYNKLKKDEINHIHNIDFFKSGSLDCVVNVAGGWLGGGLESEDVIEKMNQMTEMNLNSSLLAANLARKYLSTHGLFVLTGANSVKNSMNPGMIAYHLSKQSVHHLTELLTECNVLPESTKVVTILPNTIDTESNRKAMPDAKFEDWTKTDKISELIKGWADSKNYPKENFFKV